MSDQLIGDIETTWAQNRNYALARGFRDLTHQAAAWSLFLRYQAQAERQYRRALEEFERLQSLRASLPNEPITVPQPEPEQPLTASSTEQTNPPTGSVRQHGFPASLIASDAEPVGGTDQGQAEQLGVPLDALQQLGVGHFQIPEAGVQVSGALRVDELAQAEPVDEPLDLAGRHGLLIQID